MSFSENFNSEKLTKELLDNVIKSSDAKKISDYIQEQSKKHMAAHHPYFLINLADFVKIPLVRQTVLEALNIRFKYIGHRCYDDDSLVNQTISAMFGFSKIPENSNIKSYGIKYSTNQDFYERTEFIVAITEEFGKTLTSQRW